MKALREVTKEEFFGFAQSGARELFELGHFKVLDAKKDGEPGHFVYEMKTHRCYLIDRDACYDLVTAFYVDDNKEFVSENLNAIASSIA